MLTFFESCQLDDTFLFEKLYFLYLQGLFEVMRGNAEGEMKIQEVLSVLEILDAPFVEANLREYAQMMIKK